MASFISTYAYSDLVTLADKMVSGVATSGIDVTACDVLNSLFWCHSYPWRWATAALTAIAMVDGTQDYVCANTNILQLLSMRMVRTDTTPDQYKDLMVMKWLEEDLTFKCSFPNFNSIAYLNIADANKIRLPGAISVPSGQTLQLQGEYKKNPTKITSTSATIVFPDHYAHVFIAGLIWYYYKFSRDKRQGTLQLAQGTPIYTGALGEFHDAMLWCAQQEDYAKGDTKFPDEPIGASASSNITGLFGPF